ncbi:unnamed protein product [Rotaria sp. Silwood1]|nr:unnamed protein product [Rotaria sp. Silwood1]CAF3757199.1 unnamed protein product [Rotaria sp. Silwood1]CAF4982231.1 unnamed protein product [Rotaria sp. Silwood1]
MNIFYERFDSYINKLDIKKRNKYTIKDEMYLNITNVLKQEDVNASAKFKFWTRRSFRLMEIGSSHLIYNIKNNLPLITYEKIYEKINECHIAVGHSGRDKTWAEVLILIVLPLNNNTTLHRANIILNLKLDWPDLIIINGRPRHPQSQGLVERANAVVQKMLGKWLETNESRDWPSGLGPVMLAINNCRSQSTKKTPYEMVFGQRVRSDHDFWLQIHQQTENKSIINEEELPTSIIDDLNFGNEEFIEDDCLCDATFSKTLVLSSDINKFESKELNNHDSHKRIRDEAEKNYIRTAERQLKNYQQRLKRQKVYQINDIVGLKIAEVDRSNTAPSILPCKIIEVIRKEESLNTLYKLVTVDGIITDLFSSTDLIDLSETISAELRQLDHSTVPNITFIQACQIFTQFKAINSCKCMGSCDTKRCPCKRQSIKCCSKCHRGKCVSCKNNI